MCPRRVSRGAAGEGAPELALRVLGKPAFGAQFTFRPMSVANSQLPLGYCMSLASKRTQPREPHL